MFLFNLLASLALLLTCCVHITTADFLIYGRQDTPAEPVADPYQFDLIAFFEGEPSCDDVCGGKASYAPKEDVNKVEGVRCVGCDSGPVADWDIKELEVHLTSNVTVHGELHWTLYGNSGYYLTPADGSELKGQCERVNDDDFDCDCTTRWEVRRYQGAKLFSCSTVYVYDDVDW